MLKIRIIGKVVVLDGRVIQTYVYSDFKFAGDLYHVLTALNDYGVDEIILVDLDAVLYGNSKILNRLSFYTSNLFCPLTYSGGIKSYEMAKLAFQNGADRVAVNRALHTSSDCLNQIVNTYGSQAVVGVCDLWVTESGINQFDYLTRDLIPLSHSKIQRLLNNGSGQLQLNIVNNSGLSTGFDRLMLRGIMNLFESTKPILIGGGFRDSEDIQRAIDEGFAGIIIGNKLLHFEHSVAVLKGALKSKKLRANKELTYNTFGRDEYSRIKKLDDQILNRMLFTKLKDDSLNEIL